MKYRTFACKVVCYRKWFPICGNCMCSKLIWGTCNEREILRGRDNWLSGDDFAQTEHEIALRNNLVHEGLFVRQIRNVQINRNTIDVTIAFLICITGESYLILPDYRYWQRLKQIILNSIYPSKIDISRSTGNEPFNASNWEGKTLVLVRHINIVEWNAISHR